MSNVMVSRTWVEEVQGEVERLRAENARQKKRLGEVEEALHDASLFLESADWKFGVGRPRSPWDNDLRSLVLRLRALEAPRLPPAEGIYPPGWPKCACGDYCMDGKATCGRVECLP